MFEDIPKIIREEVKRWMYKHCIDDKDDDILDSAVQHFKDDIYAVSNEFRNYELYNHNFSGKLILQYIIKIAKIIDKYFNGKDIYERIDIYYGRKLAWELEAIDGVCVE